MQKTIEERVERIEKIFWAIGAIAVIFGLSGAWGYKVISAAKTEIETLEADIEPLRKFVNDADKFIEMAKEDIENAKDLSIHEMRNMSDDLALESIQRHSKNRLASAKTNGHIKKLGMHTELTLNVNKGEVIHAIYTGSARGSQFYYRIVDVSEVSKPMAGSIQVIMVPADSWRSITATESFVAKHTGTIQLAIEFFKSDVSGDVKVYGSTLVASIIGSI